MMRRIVFRSRRTIVDVPVLHLDRDPRAIVERRLVNLPERGAAIGVSLNVLNGSLMGAHFGPDAILDFGKGARRNGVL